MKNIFALSLFVIIQIANTPGLLGQDPIVIKKIYDAAPYSSCPDIAYFRDKLFIAFREGASAPGEKAGDHGKIRILSSNDSEYWEPVALIEIKGLDLRDPKLAVTSKNKLLILMDGAKVDNGKLIEFKTYYSISDGAGKKFSMPEPVEYVNFDGNFKRLWRLSWHDKTGYGVAYSVDENGMTDQSQAWLVKTGKGIELEMISDLKADGAPNKATIGFAARDEMMMLLRRDSEDKSGLFGKSKPPYTEWSWEKLNFSLFAPDFELIPINKIVIGMRMIDENGAYVALMLGKEDLNFHEIMRLTSGGDTGCPGMVSIGGYIWMTFHSSHQGKTAIYFTKIPYNKLN